METITANWDSILLAITTLVTFASIVAKITPNTVDDGIVGKVIKFMDILAINTTPTETKK